MHMAARSLNDPVVLAALDVSPEEEAAAVDAQIACQVVQAEVSLCPTSRNPAPFRLAMYRARRGRSAIRALERISPERWAALERAFEESSVLDEGADDCWDFEALDVAAEERRREAEAAFVEPVLVINGAETATVPRVSRGARARERRPRRRSRRSSGSRAGPDDPDDPEPGRAGLPDELKHRAHARESAAADVSLEPAPVQRHESAADQLEALARAPLAPRRELLRGLAERLRGLEALGRDPQVGDSAGQSTEVA